MKEKLYFSWEDFYFLADTIVNEMLEFNQNYNNIYAVPRGGQVLATYLSHYLEMPMISKDKITDKTLIVDDIIDSGSTRKRFKLTNDFVCLHSSKKENLQFISNRNTIEITDKWVVYPWEEEEQSSVDDTVIRFLEYIGEDPNREGLADTPKRVIKSWNELYNGYEKNILDIMTTFEAPNNKMYNQIVLLKDIELFSMCEHHILPFIGKAHIAYIPDMRVIGISKLARIMEVYARRLQIQERLGHEITEAIMYYLAPKGAACIIEAQHLCMRMRGVSKQNSTMITSSLKGVFLQDNDQGRSARKELMDLIK